MYQFSKKKNMLESDSNQPPTFMIELGFCNMIDDPDKISSTSMSSFLKKKASQAKTQTSEATGKVGKYIGEKNQEYGITSSVQKARDAVGDHTPEELKKVVDKAGESLDIISGSKIMKDVEKMISLQAKYNDILASKLEEALQRIATLEAMMDQNN